MSTAPRISAARARPLACRARLGLNETLECPNKLPECADNKNGIKRESGTASEETGCAFATRTDARSEVVLGVREIAAGATCQLSSAVRLSGDSERYIPAMRRAYTQRRAPSLSEPCLRHFSDRGVENGRLSKVKRRHASKTTTEQINKRTHTQRESERVRDRERGKEEGNRRWSLSIRSTLHDIPSCMIPRTEAKTGAAAVDTRRLTCQEKANKNSDARHGALSPIRASERQ